MPTLNGPNGEVVAEAPYTPEGVELLKQKADQMGEGFTISYNEPGSANEFSQAAMAEQQQLNAEVGDERMSAMMNPDPMINSPQSGGMY
jgi:hypothetical protein